MAGHLKHVYTCATLTYRLNKISKLSFLYLRHVHITEVNTCHHLNKILSLTYSFLCVLELRQAAKRRGVGMIGHLQY
jgi:hypothetical protein